jgi:hypothetical protein
MLLTVVLTLHFGGFLCDSAPHAVAFADAFVQEGEEETAANEVGKRAQQQVCGFYAGDAVVASKTRIAKDGNFYLVTQYNFTKDARMAFSAERVFDASESVDSNGTF